MSIFKENIAYRPFAYTWAVEATKKHAIEMFWDVHQIEMADDLRQWMSKDGMKTKTVSHEVNQYITRKILCLFTEMDRSVAGGYIKLLQYVKNNEIRNMWLTFGARETVHQRAYALAAETFGFTDTDWSEFSKYAEMRDKLDRMTEDLTKPEYSNELNCLITLAQVLLGEGIGLFAAFMCLLNYKRQGLFMGFNDVNQWSLVDEQEHVVNNLRVLAEGRKDLTEIENLILDQAIRKLVDAYTNAECVFLDLVYAMGDQEDLPKEDGKGYIAYLGEMRLFQMGLLEASEVRKNPLMWMEWLVAGSAHDNFFEKRVSAYSHGKLEGECDMSRHYNKLPKEVLDKLKN